MEETRTANLIAGKLREWGIEVTEGVGGTGVVGTIHGNRPGPRSLGIRADMDALALTETTSLPYASQTEGVMHACGHDGHVAVLLGASRCLTENPDFEGTVHVIFQPAEEGRGGARAMLNDGLFDRFPCDAVYALHSGPGGRVGDIATNAGPLMAGTGRFDVTFSGQGGHGGLAPHLATDLSIVQAHFVLALHTIIGRDLPASENAVISIGYLSGGIQEAFNVMPSTLTLSGTMRCYSKETQKVFDQRIIELAESLAQAHGAKAVARSHWITPPLINPEEQTVIVAAAATAAIGTDRVVTNLPPITAGEDFAFMMETRPGALVFLHNGPAADPDAPIPMIHTPNYNFNDAAIPDGVAYWVELVHQQLNG